jgi:thiosulfate dehydrogenase
MKWVPRYRYFLSAVATLIFAVSLFWILSRNRSRIAEVSATLPASGIWQAPDITRLRAHENGDLIRYGRELIANTSRYLGPKGSVASISNGMNCQNCHIDAGTVPFANCFSGVSAMYPMYRPRSGIIESIEFRINDCLKRSLNGSTIDSTGKEMQAMVAYLKWVGRDVPKGKKPDGANIAELPYIDRAADTGNGHIVYSSKCMSCHGTNGEGKFNEDSSGFVYPPLWGERSYNTGAGLYRLTRFAGYVKSSMPVGASHAKPILTDEEAWDVAAYVNTQPRPEKDFPEDWPDLSLKAIDYPSGPYTDPFTETQHKYGPFKPIAEYRKNQQAKARK